MTYDELSKLTCVMMNEKLPYIPFVSHESHFWNDEDCPEGGGEIRIRWRSANQHDDMIGRITVTREQLEAHTWESIEKLIDTIGIQALLSNGD